MFCPRINVPPSCREVSDPFRVDTGIITLSEGCDLIVNGLRQETPYVHENLEDELQIALHASPFTFRTVYGILRLNEKISYILSLTSGVNYQTAEVGGVGNYPEDTFALFTSGSPRLTHQKTRETFSWSGSPRRPSGNFVHVVSGSVHELREDGSVSRIEWIKKFAQFASAFYTATEDPMIVVAGGRSVSIYDYNSKELIYSVSLSERVSDLSVNSRAGVIGVTYYNSMEVLLLEYDPEIREFRKNSSFEDKFVHAVCVTDDRKVFYGIEGVTLKMVDLDSDLVETYTLQNDVWKIEADEDFVYCTSPFSNALFEIDRLNNSSRTIFLEYQPVDVSIGRRGTFVSFTNFNGVYDIHSERFIETGKRRSYLAAVEDFLISFDYDFLGPSREDAFANHANDVIVYNRIVDKPQRILTEFLVQGEDAIIPLYYPDIYNSRVLINGEVKPPGTYVYTGDFVQVLYDAESYNTSYEFPINLGNKYTVIRTAVRERVKGDVVVDSLIFVRENDEDSESLIQERSLSFNVGDDPIYVEPLSLKTSLDGVDQDGPFYAFPGSEVSVESSIMSAQDYSSIPFRVNGQEVSVRIIRFKESVSPPFLIEGWEGGNELPIWAASEGIYSSRRIVFSEPTEITPISSPFDIFLLNGEEIEGYAIAYPEDELEIRTSESEGDVTGHVPCVLLDRVPYYYQIQRTPPRVRNFSITNPEKTVDQALITDVILFTGETGVYEFESSNTVGIAVNGEWSHRPPNWVDDDEVVRRTVNLSKGDIIQLGVRAKYNKTYRMMLGETVFYMDVRTRYPDIEPLVCRTPSRAMSSLHSVDREFKVNEVNSIFDSKEFGLQVYGTESYGLVRRSEISRTGVLEKLGPHINVVSRDSIQNSVRYVKDRYLQSDSKPSLTMKLSTIQSSQIEDTLPHEKGLQVHLLEGPETVSVGKEVSSILKTEGIEAKIDAVFNTQGSIHPWSLQNYGNLQVRFSDTDLDFDATKESIHVFHKAAGSTDPGSVTDKSTDLRSGEIYSSKVYHGDVLYGNALSLLDTDIDADRQDPIYSSPFSLRSGDILSSSVKETVPGLLPYVDTSARLYSSFAINIKSAYYHHVETALLATKPYSGKIVGFGFDLRSQPIRELNVEFTFNGFDLVLSEFVEFSLYDSEIESLGIETESYVVDYLVSDRYRGYGCTVVFGEKTGRFSPTNIHTDLPRGGDPISGRNSGG